MNIFFMNSVAQETWGGVEKWMLVAARGLAGRGHRIVVCARPESLFVQRSREAGLEVLPLKIGSDFGLVNIYKLAAFFRRNDIQAVVANLNKDVRLAGLAGKFSTRPVVLARAGLAILPDNWTYRLTFRWLADGIITNTRSIREQYLSYGWLPGDFVRVIHNGIDIHLPAPSAREKVRERHNLPGREPVIGIFGRLVRQKQHTLFLDVFKNILKEFPEAVALIAGDGSCREEIQKYAFDLGILDSIYMLGFQKDVWDLYHYCDVVLMTSEVEGLPNVVMEAMLAGRPVVAFNVGGVDELIEDGVTGFSVPPNDIFLMTQRTLELLLSPDLRESIGRRARDFVEQNFSLEKMLDQVELYLKDLQRLKKGTQHES